MDCAAYPDLLYNNSECVSALQIDDFVATLVTLPSYNTGANRNLLQSTLDGFCNTACLENVIFYYTNCFLGSSSQLFIDFYNNIACGRNDGTYCIITLLVKLDNNDINLFEIDLQCNDGNTDTCARQECRNILQEISNSLGCCAGSLFNQSSSFVVSDDYYDNCGLSLPLQCDGSSVVTASGFVLVVTLAAAFKFLR